MKKISENLNSFGVPDPDFIVEMANLRGSDTGLPFALHVRSKEEVEKTAHPKVPTLKVYQDRPGLSHWFSVTISDAPKVLGAHQDRAFYKSLSAASLKQIFKWVSLNRDALLDFWHNGGSWFQDEKQAWEKSLKKI